MAWSQKERQSKTCAQYHNISVSLACSTYTLTLQAQTTTLYTMLVGSSYGAWQVLYGYHLVI